MGFDFGHIIIELVIFAKKTYILSRKFSHL